MSHNPSKKQSGKSILACLCLPLATALTVVQAAPLPRPKYADPAIIDAGCEGNVAEVLAAVMYREQLNVFKDEKVAGLNVVRRQKDREAWLMKNLHAERIKGTTRIQVGFRDGSPREQAVLINAAVDHCLTKGRLGRRREVLTHYAKRLKEVLDNVRRLEGAEDRVAKTEADLRKAEDIIEKLPRLLEHAKAR